MPKKRRKISKADISQRDIEAWIATNPDYRAILKEALIDYVVIEVTKKVSEFKKKISRTLKKECGDRPEEIGPATTGTFFGCLIAATNVFLSRWKQKYQEPEIEPEECRRWAVKKAEEWMNFFPSWELDDLFKNRQAIREIVAQVVDRYLDDRFWNKLEGSAMKNDPVMRRLIMRDMLGE